MFINNPITDLAFLINSYVYITQQYSVDFPQSQPS